MMNLRKKVIRLENELEELRAASDSLKIKGEKEDDTMSKLNAMRKRYEELQKKAENTKKKNQLLVDELSQANNQNETCPLPPHAH